MPKTKTPVPIPELTAADRKAAMRKAVAARKFRAAFKEQLNAGEYTCEEGIALAKADEALSRMRVREFLMAFPGWGEKKAERAIEKCGIAPSRRLRGLGKHQAALLVRIVD